MSGFDQRPPSPGKGPLAQIQRKPADPGKQTLVEAAGASSPVPLHPVQHLIDEAHSQQPPPAVQRSAGTRGAAAMSKDTVQQVAAQGVAGAGGSLPHLDMIQRLFGRHDVSGVEAHVGGPAAAASTAIGAQAYATGNRVAFAGTPSLHTAAHEAAHVVQQRGGVQLKGGVGNEGDPYEQHADAVADAVVQGNSAEALLSHYGEPHLPAVTQRGGVQRKVPAHAVTAADLGTRGEDEHAAALSDKQIQDAIASNNKHWNGGQRQELRTFLAHAHADDGGFTEADIRAVWKIQVGAGVEPAKADGVIGDTTMAILLHAGLTLSFEGDKVKAEDVQLLFIPGEFEDVARWQAAAIEAVKKNPAEPYRALVEPSGTGRVYVKVKGSIVDMVNARGGPPVTVKDFDGHTADPTTAGTWTLGTGKSVVTTSWDTSQIPWGAKVRKRADGEWEFENPDIGKWKIATGPKSQLAKPLVPEVFEGKRYNKGRNTWRINDFGEMGWRVQGTDGQFVHTTPEDEEAALAGGSPELAASHGCVHLDPTGRNRLRDRGYLQAGVKFIVRKYTVHLLPEAMRQIMQGDKPLHDKPGP